MTRLSLQKIYSAITPPWRFAISAFIILRIFYAVWSFVILTIYPLAVQNFDLNELPIVSIFNLQTSQRHIYLRNMDGQVLTFRPAGEDIIIDEQTGSIWNATTGAAIQGIFAGKSLKSEPEMVEQVFPYRGVKPYSTAWLAIWQRFDANWYLSIAEYGYGVSSLGDFHFPPFFVFLIQAAGLLTNNLFIAGLLISHLATLLAIKLLYDLFHEWLPEQAANRSIIYFLISPASFFLFSVYSEPAFLVLVIMSMRAMKKKAWIWAGFWIFCAILTRLQAIALMPVLLYLIYKDQPFLKKTGHWVGLIFPVLAGLVYLFIRLQGGENVLPTNETEWHTALALPWESYWYALRTIASGRAAFIDILNLFVATLFIFLLVTDWKKIPIEYALYVAGSLFIMLARIQETQPLSGMSRFSLSLFPMFFLLGLKGEKPILNRLIIYPSVLINLYLSAQFWMWGWVA